MARCRPATLQQTLAAFVVVTVVVAACFGTAVANVNGEYKIANPPASGPQPNLTLGRRGGRYFDVYSPVVLSLYSQVNWQTHSVDIPADVVAAFDGKVMNIVGYEFDIIRRRGGGACISSSSDAPIPCDYESVPSYEQYNHHYTNQLYGKGTFLVKTNIPTLEHKMSHTGAIRGYAQVTDAELAPENPQAPANQFLPMGNGAESRLTLHLFPPGYGALLQSPTHTTINPMIIDTKARNSTSVPGRHGPVPNSSNVAPDEMYSGIMECPCTDFFPKKEATASTLDQGTCGKSMYQTAPGCFDAAASLGLVAKSNLTVSTTTHPHGCSATAVSGGFEVVYNTNQGSQQQCGAASPNKRVVALSEGVIDVDVDVQTASMPAAPSIVGRWQIAGPIDTLSQVAISEGPQGNFTATCTAGVRCFPTVSGPVKNGQFLCFSIPGTIRADNNQIKWSNGVIFNRWWPAKETAPPVANVPLAGTWKMTAHPEANYVGKNVLFTGSNSHLVISCVDACFPPATGSVSNHSLSAFGLVAAISADFNTVSFANGVRFVRLDPSSLAGNVTVTMSGPSDVWFGAGFMDKLPVSTPGSHSGSAMDGAYAIIVLGNGTVQERQLGHHAPGTVIAPSVKVVSSRVVNGVRTVAVSRPSVGITGAHYTFSSTANSVGIIDAVGSTPDFAYHRAHADAQSYFVEAGGSTCVCDLEPPLGSTASQGTIGTVSFNSNCGPAPLGEMQYDPAWDNKTSWYTDNAGVNPTCQLKAYRGGLKCCHGGTLITDGDDARAALVAENDTDYYQTLFRYYYEDGGELYHGKPIADTYWTYWWTEYNNGEHDVPPCYNEECIDKITSNFTGANLPGAKAGVDSALVHVEGHCHIGCQAMELWNMDDPQQPALLCRTRVDYGTNDTAHNEMGYILGNRPCVFGNPADGFESPPIIKTTTKLMSVKFQNNTHPRYGDMALWEIRASYVE